MAINDIVQAVADARVDARSLSDFVFKPSGFKVPRRLAPPIDTLQFYIDRFDATKATTDAYVATIPSIVNDAINNTAVEGGVLADTFVTVTANAEGTVPRSLRDINADNQSLKTFLTPAETNDVVTRTATIDISAKLQAAFDNPGNRTLNIPDGLYYINSLVTCTRDITINFSANAKLRFGENGQILFTGSSTLLGRPSSNVSNATKSFNFIGASTLLKPYDLICVYNPTDYSWSPHRPYYRAGEFMRIANTIGDTINLFGLPIDSYLAADVDLYKINPVRVVLNNYDGSVIESGATKDPIIIRYGVDVVLDNPRNFGGQSAGITFDRCFNTTVKAGNSMINSTGNGRDYALLFANCQQFQITGGSHNSDRHCIALGGGGGECSVPTRHGDISSMTLANSSTSGAGATDMHGNCEYITYHHCTIHHASMGGANNSYKDCTIYGRPTVDGSCVWGGELLGGDFTIDDCTFITQGDGKAFGYVYMVASEPLKRDLNINVNNLRIRGGVGAPLAKLMTVFSTVKQTKKINISVDGVNSSVNEIGVVVNLESKTADLIPCDYIIVDNIRLNNDGAYLIFPNTTTLAAKTRQMTQSGSQSVTSGNNVTVLAGTEHIFKYRYSKAPNIFINVAAPESLALWLDTYLNEGVADAPFTVVTPACIKTRSDRLRPALFSNKKLPAGKEFYLSWQAGINEC